MEKKQFPTAWVAGSLLAAAQVVSSSGCTLPQQGRCGLCGGCILAVVGLSGWALLRRRQGRKPASG